MAFVPGTGESGGTIGSGTLTAGAGQYDVIDQGRRSGREELTQVEVYCKLAEAELRLCIPVPGATTHTEGILLVSTAVSTGTLPVTGSLTFDTSYVRKARFQFMWPKEAVLILVNTNVAANAYIINMRQDPM